MTSISSRIKARSQADQIQKSRWDLWKPGKGPVPLSNAELHAAAMWVLDNPDDDVTEAFRQAGVPAKHVAVVAATKGDLVLKRAQRLVVQKQNLEPKDIEKICLSYLVSVVDDDSESTKDRLKAVEIVAKLASVGNEAKDGGTEGEKVDSKKLIADIRRDVLGVRE